MITNGTRSILVMLSVLSILTNLFASVFYNYLFGKKNEVDAEPTTLIGKIFHHSHMSFDGSVCKFGIITGIIYSLFLFAQMVALASIKNEDRDRRRKLGYASLVMFLIYFCGQLGANSSISSVARKLRKNYRRGLWDDMIPTYVLQLVIIIILLTEKNDK